MSDAGRLEEPSDHPRKSWFEGEYDRSNEPDCYGPRPVHKPPVKPMKKTVKAPDHDIRVFAALVDRVVDESRGLLIRKQKDYGPFNISRAPGGPLNGLRVRIFDKISRINNLLDTGVTPENESLRDSFIDLANYGLIGLMVLDGTWPELPEEKK